MAIVPNGPRLAPGSRVSIMGISGSVCTLWNGQTGNRALGLHRTLRNMSHLYSLGRLPGRPWRWIKASSFGSKCTRPGRLLHPTAAQAGFMDKVFGDSREGSDKGQNKKQQQEQQQVAPATDLDAEEGGKFVPIDLKSSGGLGGSSEEIFGPLVSHIAKAQPAVSGVYGHGV